MSYKIEHDRMGCIGCGACAGTCPQYWTMIEDGKSKLTGSKPLSAKQGWEYKEFPNDEGLECNTQAANACPVQVIHIVKQETTKPKTKKK